MGVALVLVGLILSGSAFAAGALVTSAQIKNGTIQLVDLSPTAIKSLRGQDGRDGVDGQSGPAGPPGPAGAVGPPGVAGGFNPAKVTITTGGQASIPTNGIGTSTAVCPSGAVILGGGFSGTGDPFISGPDTRVSWRVSASTEFSGGATVTAYAVCGSP